MKILFLGDIVGKAGRRAVAAVLPQLRLELEPDFVIANGENLAHGIGASKKTIKQTQAAGVDFFTSGNHIFKTDEAAEILQDESYHIIRPANYPAGVPGVGYRIVEAATGKKLLIANVLGQVFFKENVLSPLIALDDILEKTKNEKLAGIIVDAHMETTSEKQVFGHYFDGRVSAVIGTHTHIPTADERILPGGTAFISDAGMVGLQETSLGVDLEPVTKEMLTQLPQTFTWSEAGLCRVDAVLVEIKSAQRALGIKRINRTGEV